MLFYILFYYNVILFYYNVLLQGVLELTCPTACACHFKLRPGVLCQTLSHMWGKLILPYGSI